MEIKSRETVTIDMLEKFRVSGYELCDVLCALTDKRISDVLQGSISYATHSSQIIGIIIGEAHRLNSENKRMKKEIKRLNYENEELRQLQLTLKTKRGMIL